MNTISKVSRREIVQHVAIAYAEFSVEYEGRTIQPLNREFAFASGRAFVDDGRYVPRSCLGLDWSRIATDARKALPYWQRVIREGR